MEMCRLAVWYRRSWGKYRFCLRGTLQVQAADSQPPMRLHSVVNQGSTLWTPTYLQKVDWCPPDAASGLNVRWIVPVIYCELVGGLCSARHHVFVAGTCGNSPFERQWRPKELPGHKLYQQNLLLYTGTRLFFSETLNDIDLKLTSSSRASCELSS
jgi:hypothetical protein